MTENLILKLRNIGSLVTTQVIQEISLLMQSCTTSEKWQSLVTPFRGVSRAVPMLISTQKWLLSVEPFRGVSCEMTTSRIEYRRCDHRAMVWSKKNKIHIIMGYIESCYRRLYLAVCQGLNREARIYTGTCQLDECRIMRLDARSRVHLTARPRDTKVSSPGITYIRTPVRVPGKVHRASTRGEVPEVGYLGTYMYYCIWTPRVARSVTGTDSWHMVYTYLYYCIWTPRVTRSVTGTDSWHMVTFVPWRRTIRSDCKIGCDCGKILSEKQERPEDTKRLIELGIRRCRRVVYRSRCRTRGTMLEIERKTKVEFTKTQLGDKR